MASYYTILTSVGQSKVANAVALGQKVNLSALAVGDANGVTPQPNANAKALIHERRRAPLNRVEIDKENPNFIVCEQVLPPEVGGWEIREIGVFDDEGNLIAYGNYPPTYKPLMNEGTSRTQTVRLVMQVSDTASVTLKVDPSVVLATRQYVDDAKRENAKALKAVKDGLGAAAAMRHSDASLINLSGDKNEVADTAQLVELKKEVDAALRKLGSAAEMSHSSDSVGSLSGSHSEVADTAQLVELRNRFDTLKEGARRGVLGNGDIMSANYLKESHIYSYTKTNFQTVSDNQLRSVSGTEITVKKSGTYFISGSIRAWADGYNEKSASIWVVAFMNNGAQCVPVSAGVNTKVGNKDASASLLGVIWCNVGDVITTGFAHDQGDAWGSVQLYSTVTMLRIGD